MGKIIFICGQICSGKSLYTKKLLREMQAVVLSTDELFLSLSLEFADNGEYESVWREALYYLYKKAEEIAGCGVTVIFDCGFWRKSEREYASKYFSERGIAYEWHYIDVSDKDWKENIRSRNALVLEKKVQAYYVDDGLLSKAVTVFEKPSKQEIDVWITDVRRMQGEI